MKEKLNGVLQIRVEKASKLRFLRAAEEKGESPADLIREFIKNYGEAA